MRSPFGLEPVLIDGDTDGLHVRQHADEGHLYLVQRIQQPFRLIATGAQCSVKC